MEKETCKDCELIMLKSLWWLDIEQLWEARLYDLDIDSNICIKCLVRVLKRFIK